MSWSYAAALKKLPDPVRIDQLPQLAAPVRKGQTVVLIPGKEAIAWNNVERSIGKASSDTAKPEVRRVYYRDAISSADRFFHDYPNGYFEADVLFQRGYALYQLKRYEDAIDDFQDFLDRYPFHPSASGARDWIERAKKRIGSPG